MHVSGGKCQHYELCAFDLVDGGVESTTSSCKLQLSLPLSLSLSIPPTVLSVPVSSVPTDEEEEVKDTKMGSDPKLEHQEEEQPPQHQKYYCEGIKMELAEDNMQQDAEATIGREAKEAIALRLAYNYMKGGGGGGVKKEEEEEMVRFSPSGTQQGAFAVAEDEDEMAAEIEADLIFSDEAFPSLPDFPCLSSPSNAAACPSSSSSSSSSTSSSSLSTSWAIGVQRRATMGPLVLSPAEGDASMSTISSPPSDGNQMALLEALDSDCSIDLLAEMDLLVPSDDPGWDPSSLFPDDMEENGDGSGEQVARHHRQQQELLRQQQQQLQYLTLEEGLGAAGQGGSCTSEELAMVFLEWLKSNKETISSQDLRSIRLRRSTIECAARNLGGGKEGMKKLLKLILAWVQNHHLQKMRRPPHYAGDAMGAGDREDANMATTCLQQQQHQQTPIPLTPNPNPCHCTFMPVNDPSHGLPACSSWGAPLEYPAGAVASFPSTPMSCTRVGDALYSPGATPPPMHPFSPSSTAIHGAVEPICSWPPAHPFSHQLCSAFPTPAPGHQLAPSPYNAPACLPGHYGAMGQLFHQGPGEPLVRSAASATKEARKNRMARSQSRRFSSLHHHYQRTQQQQQQQAVQLQQCASGVPGEALCSQTSGGLGNWSVWPSTSASPQQVAAALAETKTAAMQQRWRDFPAGSTPPERRQGWKTEKNLRFLLQKVLKQSDVGSLGRIVLPKKEAEIHLPELDARDGITIAMEDIGTSRTWNMRYRFWPNNKSRMYLLENTGDFVRSNGLQEGDFIVIYSDVRCGKYMIRGVKVRQPAAADSKVDGRDAGKHALQKNGHTGRMGGTRSSSSCCFEKKENTTGAGGK